MAAQKYRLPAACYALGVCFHDGYFFSHFHFLKESVPLKILKRRFITINKLQNNMNPGLKASWVTALVKVLAFKKMNLWLFAYT
jgi:hypothetical protein